MMHYHTTRFNVLFSILGFLLLYYILPVSSSSEKRPVVGILSHPLLNDTHHYIAASYVKWLESAGARSIAIPYDATEPLVKEIFSQINGFFLPGGNAALPNSARVMWALAVKSNARGDYFPVWGTCLGLEFVCMLAAEMGDGILESGFVAENISLPLLFPSQRDVLNSDGVFSIESDLYPPLSTMRNLLSRENLTMNNHHMGVTPQRFMVDKRLNSTFHITSYNLDATGRSFVSTIEPTNPKTFPVYATQYHPEKNNFEYGLVSNGNDVPYESINHSEDAITVSIYLARFFVALTRKCHVGIYNKVERHPIINMYEVRRGEEFGLHGFEQIFRIPPSIHWNTSESLDAIQNLQIKNTERLRTVYVLNNLILFFILICSYILSKYIWTYVNDKLLDRRGYQHY